jgi:putative ABC transport system permease protein
VRLQSVSPGFNAANVISLRLGASGRQFQERTAANEFFRQIGDRIATIVGVYGVMSHLVTQGTHDIGVCMALGAPRGGIVRMVIRRGMELTAAGLALGLIGAVLLTWVMSSLLFGVSATDVPTFTIVPLLLIVNGLAASYLPARRATLVDPVVALREE